MTKNATVPAWAPPMPEPPLKSKKKQLFKLLNMGFIDRYCAALRACFFEKKAMSYLGHSPDTLMEWKRAGREYREELEERGRAPDRKDPRYIALFLLYRIERVKFEIKARHFENVEECAFGIDGEIATGTDGEVIRDGQGRPVMLRTPVPRDWKASKYILSVLDRDYAERLKQELQVTGPEDDEGTPTKLEVEIVPSRPDPEEVKSGTD